MEFRLQEVEVLVTVKGSIPTIVDEVAVMVIIRVGHDCIDGGNDSGLSF